MSPASQIYAKITGPIVMVGFGSIGKGTLPMIERHLDYDKSRITVIDPKDEGRKAHCEKHNVRFIQQGVTRDNYRALLAPLLTEGGGQGFCVNLSVDTGSTDIMELCNELGALYIDTVNEPWLGFYFDSSKGPEARSNYALREATLAAKKARPAGSTTAVSCCGANPGSVEGFLSEGVQPSELGWGTHEKWMPENARTHEAGCGAAIYLMQPGANTRVRTWCPTRGAQYGFLVTHNESISIADYFTVRDASGTAVYRPTCHYAYHPADDAVLSLHEMFGRAAKMQEKHHILDENEIVDGIDELGVLLFGHDNNAYWYGSQLSIEETRKLAPYQNATGLQVTSAVLGGMVWALENPNEGIVEADEMDFDRLLEIQLPYLGPVKGFYTDWTPLEGRPGLFPEDIDTSDPWQFKNVLVR